jgi:hypothetical protein
LLATTPTKAREQWLSPFRNAALKKNMEIKLLPRLQFAIKQVLFPGVNDV